MCMHASDELKSENPDHILVYLAVVILSHIFLPIPSKWNP